MTLFTDNPFEKMMIQKPDYGKREKSPPEISSPVSYPHLDVYKRQPGQGIACKLRVLLQGFVILKIDVCLKRCLFCLCRFPVGFQPVSYTHLS